MKSVAVALLATIVLAGCAASAPAARERLPTEPFTHAPEKPHDPTALIFTFVQLEHYYRVPGEFTHRLTGDAYGFEKLSNHPNTTRIGPNPLIPAPAKQEEP
jgi:hypothetical protein